MGSSKTRLKNTPCKNGFKKHPLQNRTNVQIKGGGGQRPFEQCSKKLHFFERGASLSSVCPNFHCVTLVAFVMAVLQKLVLFFLQRPSWQYCAEPRHPHFLLHWTGRANKHINNRWTIRQGWTPFPWGKQAALPLHPCPAPSHGKARKHEALEGQNWHRSHRRIAFFQSSKFEYSFAKILLSLTRW